MGGTVGGTVGKVSPWRSHRGRPTGRHMEVRDEVHRWVYSQYPYRGEGLAGEIHGGPHASSHKYPEFFCTAGQKLKRPAPPTMESSRLEEWRPIPMTRYEVSRGGVVRHRATKRHRKINRYGGLTLCVQGKTTYMSVKDLLMCVYGTPKQQHTIRTYLSRKVDTTDLEEWRPIPNIPYEISKHGEIRSKSSRKILKINEKGRIQLRMGRHRPVLVVKDILQTVWKTDPLFPDTPQQETQREKEPAKDPLVDPANEKMGGSIDEITHAIEVWKKKLELEEIKKKCILLARDNSELMGGMGV